MRIESNSSLFRETYIENYSGFTERFRGIKIHKEKCHWEFDEGRTIPVYSIWDYSHHREIARQIADGKTAAIYMWGSYGVGMLLKSQEWQNYDEVNGRNESTKLRQSLKKDRPWNQKFASIIHPDDLIDIWDIDRLHESLSYLQWASKRWELFEAGPVHIIAPVKGNNPHLDRALVREEDGTASNFYMPHPGFQKLVLEIRKLVKNATFGGGSFNYHGEEPAYDTRRLHEMISQKPDWQNDLGLVITCEITEAFQLDRGGLQIRLAQKGSDGISEVVREGTLMPETWSNYNKIPIKAAKEGVKRATSAHPYKLDTDLILDWKVKKSKELMVEYDCYAA